MPTKCDPVIRVRCVTASAGSTSMVDPVEVNTWTRVKPFHSSLCVNFYQVCCPAYLLCPSSGIPKPLHSVNFQNKTLRVDASIQIYDKTNTSSSINPLIRNTACCCCLFFVAFILSQTAACIVHFIAVASTATPFTSPSSPIHSLSAHMHAPSLSLAHSHLTHVTHCSVPERGYATLTVANCRCRRPVDRTRT